MRSITILVKKTRKKGRKTMKKLLIFLLAAVLTVLTAVAFVGCDETSGTSASGDVSSQAGEKDNIDAQDFSLTISMERTVFSKGGDGFVSIELKNTSDKSAKLVYNVLFVPDFSTATDLPPVSEQSETIETIVPAGSSITGKINIGDYFAPGTHEIRYKAVFYVNEVSEETAICLYSNPIEITVNESSFIRFAEELSLTLSADKTVFSKGEDAFVTLELKNLTNETVKIFYYILFIPDFPTEACPSTLDWPMETTEITIEAGGSFTKRYNLKGYFDPGTHEIRYKTTVFVNEESAENEFSLHSNFLLITFGECSKSSGDWSEYFDLSDEKIPFNESWVGINPNDICTDTIYVCLKKQLKSIHLTANDFNNSNIVSIEYINFEPNQNKTDDKEYMKNFRQDLYLHLAGGVTNEELELIIRDIEKLDFVKKISTIRVVYD